MINDPFTLRIIHIGVLASDCEALHNRLIAAKQRTGDLHLAYKDAIAREAQLREEWESTKRRGNDALFELMLHTSHRRYMRFLEAS